MLLATSVKFDESVYDVDENVGLAQFSLGLSNPSSFDITVEVFNINITALGKHSITMISCGIILTYNVTGGGIDYNSGPYPVTFPAGETVAYFNVSIRDDDVLEGNEKFNVTINATSLPTQVIVSDPNQATVTVVDDDGKHNMILLVA